MGDVLEEMSLSRVEEGGGWGLLMLVMFSLLRRNKTREGEKDDGRLIITSPRYLRAGLLEVSSFAQVIQK